jgi:hypothetical protein
MTADFNTRARKGIQTIEAYESGATDRINLDTLDLFNLTTCALAQSIGRGDFGRGRDLLGVAEHDNVTAKYGFSLTSEENWEDHGGNYAALREAWVTELTAYRTAKAALVAD